MLTFWKGQPALLPESQVTVRFSCTKVDARLRLSPNLNTGVRHYRPGECALGGECPGLPSLVDLRLQATEQLQTPREDCRWWGTSQLTPGLFGDRDNTSVYIPYRLRDRELTITSTMSLAHISPLISFFAGA